jgi:hypothetical protein
MKKLMKQAVLSLLVFLSTGSILVEAQPVLNPSNGHWYQLIEVLPIGDKYCVTWAEARDWASSLSYQGRPGHLAVVTSSDENSFIINTFSPFSGDSEEHVWLGGYQLPDQSSQDGGWRWATGETWSYTYWGGGEPNDCCTDDENNEENCLEYKQYEDGSVDWNDTQCTDCLYFFIVEYEPERPSSIPTLTGWGMMIFIVITGLSSVYYLKRRKRAVS